MFIVFINIIRKNAQLIKINHVIQIHRRIQGRKHFLLMVFCINILHSQIHFQLCPAIFIYCIKHITLGAYACSGRLYLFDYFVYTSINSKTLQTGKQTQTDQLMSCNCIGNILGIHYAYILVNSQVDTFIAHEINPLDQLVDLSLPLHVANTQK